MRSITRGLFLLEAEHNALLQIFSDPMCPNAQRITGDAESRRQALAQVYSRPLRFNIVGYDCFVLCGRELLKAGLQALKPLFSTLEVFSFGSGERRIQRNCLSFSLVFMQQPFGHA